MSLFPTIIFFGLFLMQFLNIHALDLTSRQDDDTNAKCFQGFEWTRNKANTYPCDLVNEFVVPCTSGSGESLIHSQSTWMFCPRLEFSLIYKATEINPSSRGYAPPGTGVIATDCTWCADYKLHMNSTVLIDN
jgi:hypothetical protein